MLYGRNVISNTQDTCASEGCAQVQSSEWEWYPLADLQPHRKDGWEFTCDSKLCQEPATLHVENDTSRFFVCAHHAPQIPNSKVTAKFNQNVMDEGRRTQKIETTTEAL